MPTRLVADQIQVNYAPGAPPALAALSLALTPGVFTGIIGPNGSGKSTLVRALSRALRPSGGAVFLGGSDLYAAHSARDSARSIAVMPQETSVSLDFSVRDIVRMGRAPHLPARPFASETPADEQIVAGALKSVQIEHLAERLVTTLSGGEQQRVLFARALAQQPQILLLDEPTASLDLRHQAETLTLAGSLAHAGGLAVLAVLHDVNLASAYCDRLVLLQDGEIAASGTPGEVLTAENLAQAYGARVWVRPHPATHRPLILPLPALPPAPPVPKPRVHIICGAGTGAELLLALHAGGFAVTAGALHAGDTDADAARLLGIPFAAEAPFSLLSYAALEEAAHLAADASAIVLTDVPFGRSNLANLEAALLLRRAGKPVFCCRGTREFAARDFTGGRAAKIWAELLALGMAAMPDNDALFACLTSSEQSGDWIESPSEAPRLDSGEPGRVQGLLIPPELGAKEPLTDFLHILSGDAPRWKP